MLFVPLLKDGAPIGMIGPTRVEPGPFAEQHIQLLKTFADQAVIAISNVRDVQMLAGHSILRTTQRYIEPNPEAQLRVVEMV